MSDLRESIGGFLGSSTIQVRDSSPGGQNDDAVEAILVPEGEVSFSQESLDEGAVTMQNVQLVGDNLVLMDGDMIVSEESGAILVQNGMYVDAEQLDGQAEQMIAYIPESVPDQGQSLVIEESEVGIQRMEDSIQVEEGIYETNAAVHAEVAPRVEDQRIEEVPTAPDHPDDTQAVLIEFNVDQGEIEDTDGATYVEIDSDRILLQEVPEQATAEMQNVVMEPMEMEPSQSERLQELQLEDGDVVRAYAAEDPSTEQEAPESVQPGYRGDFRPPDEPLLFSDGPAQSESDAGTRDQELQVVPDGSETVPSKTFMNENLHETMDGGGERVSPPATASLGIQMVPSSGENSRDAPVQQSEETPHQDAAYTEPGNDEQTDELNEPEDEEVMGNVLGPISQRALVWRAEEEGHQEEEQDIQPEPGLVHQEDQQLLATDEEAQCASQDQQFVDSIVQAIPGDQEEQSVQEASGEHMNEQIMLIESTSDGNEQNVARVYQIAEGQDVEQGYEMCIALPDGQDGTVDFAQEGGGSRTITVPINIGGQVQEIPIQIPDWADLSQQSLVAVTEDGTHIPLTFVQEEDDGDSREGGSEQRIEVHLDSDMQQCVPVDESELIAIQDGDSGVILAQGGDNQYEVINMMEPQEYEFQDGVIRLLQKTRCVDMDTDISPATSVTPFFFDGSGMGIPEQSILPDSPGVIQIPEEAYQSGQPIELQMIEVPGGRGRRGSARAPRKRRPYQRHTPRQPRRSQGTSGAESQKAVKSIGRDSALLNEQQYVAVQEERPKDPSQIELSNETASVISPENMQALIQVLQSLPNTARGQTIQIVLQNDQVAAAAEEDQAQPKTSDAETSAAKDQQIKVIRMPSQFKTTSDMAVQVTPGFLEGGNKIMGNGGEGTAAEVGSTLPRSTTITVLTEDIVPQSNMNVLAEDDSFLFGNGKTPRRQKAASKRKTPKKIVTVEEVQYMIDPKPGVSYYAVVDYMSEHDQDGFSSASEMRRPEPQYSGFMEDHLELYSTSEQTKGRSILESTVDSAVTVTQCQYQRRKYTRSSSLQSQQQPKQDGGAIDLPLETDQTSVTLSERTYEQALLEEDLVGIQAVTQVRRRRRSRTRASRPVIERFEHRCGYCEFGSPDKILVVEHCISEHSSLPVKTLSLLPQMTGRMCPYCLQSFDHLEFFAHMRFAHNEVHPFKCGYCEFMGRDRNQVRHHIQKKHRLPMKVINLLDSNRRPEDAESRCGSSAGAGKKRIMAFSEGEDTVYEYLTDEEEMEDQDSDNANAKRDLVCPECKRAFKTLKYLKTHIKIHQSLRYQCSYCDFISVMLHQVIRHCQKKHAGMAPKVLTKELDPDKYAVVSRDMDSVIEKVFSLNTRLPRDPDAAKWMRKWFCPHCDYACQFGASYRRHLRMHANILPYKCNYCSFKGREKYYVRRHIHRMHKDLPMIVVENNPENCARDTSSDEDYQEKGLRRRRRRRTKDAEHAVVPLGQLEDELLGPHFQKLPVGERGTRSSRREAMDELENELPVDSGSGYRTRAATGMQRMSRAKLWSEENLDNYIKEQVGDTIVCKMCGERTHEKVFHKHARKHFKLRPLKCGYCNYMSMEMSRIRQHNGTKHPGAPLKLEECHLASVTPEDFMDLIGGDEAVATGDVQENDPLTAHFECPFCQATLAYTERCLQEHFYAHYDYYPFKCSECDFQATSEHKVVEHGASHETEIVVYQIEMDKPHGLEETIRQFLNEGERIAAQRVSELLEQSAVPAAADGAVDGVTVSIFQCPMCDQQMTLHEVMVRRHLYEHYGYEPFKCGHCGCHGATKGAIKRHAAAAHGPAKPRIRLSDEPMPEDLAKILRHIRSVMKLSPERMESAVIPSEETVRLAADHEDPLTAEGRRWKEALGRGTCPWCDAAVAGPRAKLHAHLLGHFSTSPFRCRGCRLRFAIRRDAEQHAAACRTPEQEPAVVEVLDDEAEMRKGLLQFMKSKRTAVGARSLMKDTAADETAEQAEAAETETLTTIEDEMKKLIGEGKEVQYQVVILSEDGTVVETMDVMAQQQPVADAVTAEEVPAARDVRTPSIEDEAGNTLVLSLEDVVEKAAEVQKPDAVSQAVADVLPAEVLAAAETGKEDDKQGSSTGIETADAETGVSIEAVDAEEVHVQNAAAAANDKTAEDIGKTDAAIGGHEGMAEEAVSDGEKKDRDDFDAEIVTVDRVLLTRSFRSETEDSGDDDVVAGSPMSLSGSSDGSVNSDEEDDDDEMLAIGPSLEFVGDVISLLKHASAAAAANAEKPAKVYKFMCQHCGITFPRSAMLQRHIAEEHQLEGDAGFHHCDHCSYADANADKVRAHEKVVHPKSTATATSPESSDAVPDVSAPETLSLEDLEAPKASRGTKRAGSEGAKEPEQKRTKTAPDPEETSARGQKRSAGAEPKRTKTVPEARADLSNKAPDVDSALEVPESCVTVSTATVSAQNSGEDVTAEATLLQPEVPVTEESEVPEDEEETIENITRMVQEGESSGTAMDIDAQDDKGSVPVEDAVAGSVQANTGGMVAVAETTTSEEQSTISMSAVQASTKEELVESSAHKSAPSRLEASKRESVKKMLEQEVTDMAPVSDVADPTPSTSTMSEAIAPQQPSATVTSKPSRLEAFKLEALRRAQSKSTKDATEEKKPLPMQKATVEESKTSPPKPTRKSSRVVRLSKRPRRLPDSDPAAVQVGKYKLRVKARTEEAAVASKKSKAGKAAAKSLMKAKTSAAKAAAAKTTDKSKAEPKKRGPKPKTVVEASTSRSPVKSEEAVVPTEASPEEALDALENLEECDENLPKILQILQLRPSKDQEKP